MSTSPVQGVNNSFQIESFLDIKEEPLSEDEIEYNDENETQNENSINCIKQEIDDSVRNERNLNELITSINEVFDKQDKTIKKRGKRRKYVYSTRQKRKTQIKTPQPDLTVNSPDTPITSSNVKSNSNNNAKRKVRSTPISKPRKLIYKCKHCPLSFSNIRKLDRHCNHVHDVSNYECEQCLTKFTSIASYRVHMNTHLNIQFECKECEIFYKYRRSLNKHKEVYHCKNKVIHKCKHCLKTFYSKKYLKYHIDSHTDSQYECYHCSKSFNTKSMLKYHMRAVHDEDVHFECDVCNKTFKFKHLLRWHVNRHLYRKKIKCKHCKKLFISSDTLKKHMDSHCENKSKYICNVCFQEYSRLGKLKTHLQIHYGQIKFQCDICTKHYTNKHNLLQHVEIHRTQRFICSLCSRGFKYKRMLISHINDHNTNKLPHCVICNKYSPNRHAFNKHIKKYHSGKIKTYLCDQCDKEYATRSGLGRHVREVHDKRTFECLICEKSFVRKFNMDTHMKVKHKLE